MTLAMQVPIAILPFLILTIRPSFGDESAYVLLNETEWPIVNVSGVSVAIFYENDTIDTTTPAGGNCIGKEIDRKARISLPECAQLCKQTQGCVGAAYHVKTRRCWLKSSMDTCHPVAGSIFTLHPNLACEDGDIEKIRHLDLMACITKCGETANCSGVLYNSQQECLLKSGKSECETDSGGLTVWVTKPPVLPPPPPRGGYICQGQPIGDTIGFDSDACRVACANIESCTAFTYNRTSKRCWMKSGMENCTSVEDPLVTVRANYDCPGNDVAVDLSISTMDKCIEKCRKNRNCVGLSFDKSKACNLKGRMTRCERHSSYHSAYVA